MTADRFSSILEIKVAGLVEVLMQSKCIDLDKALSAVYQSKLYEAMACEETKLWYHSPLLLLDCLEAEFRTGKPEFPDE